MVQSQLAHITRKSIYNALLDTKLPVWVQLMILETVKADILMGYYDIMVNHEKEVLSNADERPAGHDNEHAKE